MITNAKNVERHLRPFAISQSWIKELNAPIVTAKKQKESSPFLKSAAKLLPVLGMGNLNFLRPVPGQARVWVEGQEMEGAEEEVWEGGNMRIGAFELSYPLPELREPHALAMLRPWIDVGSVGTMILSQLESYFGAKQLGKLARPGNFFDFTRYRPTIYFREGRREVSIPNITITYAKQEKGQDFLFLRLLEPHALGEVYVDSVVQLLKRFGTKRFCLLGSMYDMVPHTRKLLVSGGAIGEKAEQDLEEAGIQPSDYEGPTTINFLITQQASQLNIETLWFIVHLPQYVQLEEDYIGKVRLLEVLGALYDLPKDKADVEKANQQLEKINAAIEQNPQLKSIMPQIEAQYEAKVEKREPTRLSPEVENFLRELGNRFSQN